jgi:uncharacterized cupredoxin-like copper-binding protein
VLDFGSRRLIAAIACGGGIALLAGGCGGSSASQTGAATVVNVTERDFQIKTPSHVPAGNVVFRVHNEGPDNHEFIVVRLGKHPLPLRADGMTVNEEELAPVTVGGLEPGPPGSVRMLRVYLAPGRYEAFCNMEGHFMGGMHARFTAGGG